MLFQLNDPDSNHPKSRRESLWVSEQCKNNLTTIIVIIVLNLDTNNKF